MAGGLALVLHAHLPFVRHPEHERFLEESWLFEAVTEAYLPLLQMLEKWERDRVPARITLTLSPTLCTMLTDPLLQERCARHLDELAELAQKETYRTHWEPQLHELAVFYQARFVELRQLYERFRRDLVAVFARLQEAGRVEIITSAATHALLPLLTGHPPSLRAQVLVACDHYRACFGRDPVGMWLPECAYAEGVDAVLREANIRWFITDTHGLMHARPAPRYAVFAPVFTPAGVAAFGRDHASAKQVWSRHEGYPGDVRYRDFYRDIGFDLDLEYLKPYLPAPGQRSFTGIKYHRITGPGDKEVYQRAAALEAAEGHARHFLEARTTQLARAAKVMDRSPLVVAPYDAELFGHWWYEGPEFLDAFVRKACSDREGFSLVTPTDYLARHPTNQVAAPAPSSWGEEGYWRVWLNEANEWIYPHLREAQERMTGLARKFSPRGPAADGGRAALRHRALQQAARELLLAQASDWPFIMRTGTSPAYARQRIKNHLLRFGRLHHQLSTNEIDPKVLAELESRDNIFPAVDYRYWSAPDTASAI